MINKAWVIAKQTQSNEFRLWSDIDSSVIHYPRRIFTSADEPDKHDAEDQSENSFPMEWSNQIIKR